MMKSSDSDSSGSNSSIDTLGAPPVRRFKVETVGQQSNYTPPVVMEDTEIRRPSNVPMAADSVTGGRRFSKRLSINLLSTQRSLRHYLTREKIPHADHYRMSVPKGQGQTRPTLEELLEGNARSGSIDGQGIGGDTALDPESGDKKHGKVIKFGWIEGVYMRCLLNIWGVMLFLRLTWVVGQAGLIEGFFIITLSNIVTIITTISMSAVSTNGQIKAGGIYYMISRSLGPEFGGAIGLMFTLANSIAVSMYLIGFCESLMDMLNQYVPDFDGIVDATSKTNDIRLIGSVSLVLILGLAIVGMDWVTRVQMGLLFLLFTSQIDFIIGTFLPPSDQQIANGFVGYNATVFENNLWSKYETDENGKQHNFFGVFSVFFPAVTGIVAGANLSGDLKNPGYAIPKGTLAAIATTYISYILYSFLVAGCALRRASGVVEEVYFGTDLFNETIGEELNITRAYFDCDGRDCPRGSAVDQQLMEVISAWGPLIYAGCFAATLSSAIASLVGAPRVFQAVAKDKLFPGISSFAEGCGANNDPVRGYILVFIISLVCILIGDLNQVSSLLSNFFVAAYALINFSVFHASVTNSPGWRPAFRYYNKWISLFGTVLCIVVMFLMDFRTALATFILVILLYLYIHVRNPDVNWGSSTQSQSFVSALKSVQTLTKVEDHVKNYRPKVIVMSGDPATRPCLMDFANLLTKRLSLLECVQIVPKEMDWKQRHAMKVQTQKWLQKNHIKAFYALTCNKSFSEGARVAIELGGLGKLSPNMMLIGFQGNWKSDPEATKEYFKTLQTAFDQHLSVGVLRIDEGLDISSIIQSASAVAMPIRESTIAEETEPSADQDSRYESKISVDSGMVDDVVLHVPSRLEKKASDVSTGTPPHTPDEPDTSMLNRMLWPLSKNSKRKPNRDSISVVSEELAKKALHFRGKAQKEGTIDVYWLYDDGGLTLLLPHILSTRAMFSKCNMRVFFLSNKTESLDEETRNMAALMSKFRIEYQDVIILTDATKKPEQRTVDQFKQMTSGYGCYKEPLVSQADLIAHKERTNFNLRIAEIVRENSSNASLVAMTLPLPRKDSYPASLYMAWLDFTTADMPPFLMVRGNQESVLTFYS